MMKKLCIILLALALLSGCAASSPGTNSPAEEPDAGSASSAQTAETPVPETPVPETPAPETPVPDASAPGEFSPDFVFSVTDRDGGIWTEETFAGHTLTMINFWEPWCGPCVREMPELERLYETYADRGFQILGVYSTGGMEEDVDSVLSGAGITFPILHYADSFDRFQSGYVPTTIFVDSRGHVLTRELTPHERADLSDVIAYLGEDAASALFVGSDSYEGWAEIVEGWL